MNKEDINYLREKLEKETKEELIEDVILTTKTYANALNMIANLQKENEMLIKPKIVNWENAHKIIVKSPEQARIDKAIEYIKEYCIDDEFYVNLTKKEKCIFDVLSILEGKEVENE